MSVVAPPRLDTPGVASPARPPSALDRAARRLVRARLARLRSGHVTLEDAWGQERLGEARGGGPGVTVRVRDPRFYRKAALGAVGAGEAYRDGLFECDDLTLLLRIVLSDAEAAASLERGVARLPALARRLLHALRANTRRGSRRNIRAHYDLGNEFFGLFLDRTMTYSCGLFASETTSLEEASIAKLERVCAKLELGPRDHVIEVGAGWGSFAIHAARTRGCRVTTTTISREQRAYALERVREAGLEGRVEVLAADYRDLAGEHDKLVSIEMIEAVGHSNLPRYFERCARLLKPHGRMLIQAITMPDHRYERYRRATDFIQRHIFPGCCVPSTTAMLAAAARTTDLRLVHLEDLTPHYATTLRRWRERFLGRLDDARALGLGDGFLRLWEFYLAYCEAGFAERYTGDVQLLFARPGARHAPLLPALEGCATPGGWAS